MVDSFFFRRKRDRFSNESMTQVYSPILKETLSLYGIVLTSSTFRLECEYGYNKEDNRAMVGL